MAAIDIIETSILQAAITIAVGYLIAAIVIVIATLCLYQED